MSKFYFPVMKTSDICQCLEALNVRVSEADLQKPNPNTIFRLFEALAADIMDIKYGQLPSSLSQEGTVERVLEETTDFPELHQDSLAMMMFFRQVSKVMRNIGVGTFSLKDLTNPEPLRIRVLLSAIINFARFREERYVLFDELSAQTDKLVQMKSQLLQENSLLTEKLNSIKLQRSEEEPMVDKLTAVTRELSENLKILKSNGDQINSDVARMKQEKSDIQDRVQNTQILLQHSKQEITRLKSRIVRNPDHLKRTIQDMNNSFHTLKASVLASERQQREIQMKIENLSFIGQDLAACVSLMGECETEFRNLDDINQKLYGEKDLLDRKHAEFRECQIKEQQLKRQELAAEDKINRLHHQLSLKRDAMESKLLKYRQEWEDLGSDNAETQDQMTHFAKQVGELKAKLHELRKTYDSEIATSVAGTTKLKDGLIEFMREFRHEMLNIDVL